MHDLIRQTWALLDDCRIGTTVFEYNPAERPIRYMLHLVAYDIRESRRLRQVARICSDYGLRVEYSVFECDTNEGTFNEFWQRLMAVIDPEEDAILAYRICRDCVRQIESIGAVKRPEPTLLYIV